MTLNNEVNMETGQITEITDMQKMDLFEEVMDSLEKQVLALTGDNKANRAAIKDILSLNVGSIIEEICSNNPTNGIELCGDFFNKLMTLFEGQDPAVLNQQSKDKLFFRIAHEINLKLSPLMIKKLVKLGDKVTTDSFKEDFEEDKKQYMRTGIGNFVTVFDETIPDWYNDINIRRSDKKLRLRAIHDPETAKLSEEIHDKAMRELRGEE